MSGFSIGTARLDLAPALSEEELEKARALMGREIRVEPYNHEATRDTIRHYALGIGDDNPLFCDPEYAVASVHGDLVAPPTFLYSVFDGAIGAALPGVQPIYAGTRWRFHRWVRRNEQIVPRARFGEVRNLTGQTSSEMAIQDAETDFFVGDEKVAESVSSTFRVPRRDASRGALKYEPRQEHVYSDEEIERIRTNALNEFRRGDRPLVFDDLEVGEPIPAVVKGPIDRITMTAYYAGCIGSPGYKACEVAWRYRDYAENAPEKLPSNYDPSYFAETVLPSLGHQDGDVAQEIGMPNAYNNGPQRCGWFATAVTNWMGDRALMRSLSVRLRRPEIFGDTVWISGRVCALERIGELGAIDIELWAENQLGERTATGTARVLTTLGDGGERLVSPPFGDA